jgi:hypothetical protein
MDKVEQRARFFACVLGGRGIFFLPLSFEIEKSIPARA